jgi:chromosome segregation ATPase
MNETHGHYAYEIHGAAGEHHRHYDTESELRELQSLVAGLREDLSRAEDRIRGLESQTPQARQLQLEADRAAADLAESGYDQHGRGCDCPECYDPEADEYRPRPEADAGREPAP